MLQNKSCEDTGTFVFKEKLLSQSSFMDDHILYLFLSDDRNILRGSSWMMWEKVSQSIVPIKHKKSLKRTFRGVSLSITLHGGFGMKLKHNIMLKFKFVIL